MSSALQALFYVGANYNNVGVGCGGIAPEPPCTNANVTWADGNPVDQSIFTNPFIIPASTTRMAYNRLEDRLEGVTETYNVGMICMEIC